MRRFKLQTIVCLTGLAVGMTCFALGTLWLRFIESFEDFVPEAERVYTPVWTSPVDGFGYIIYTPKMLGEKLKDKHPEVEDFSMAMPAYDRRITTDGNVSMDVLVSEADERFLRMFGIKALQGDVGHLRKDEIALTQSAARRLFGDKSALGQVVRVEINVLERDYMEDKERERVVTAIIPDCPANTQTRYEAIAGLAEGEWYEGGAYFFQTFVKMIDKADMAKFVDEQGRMMMQVEQGMSEESMYLKDYQLVPIRSLRTDENSHLHKISTTYVRWFMFIGLIVILCSLVNYLLTMVSHLKRRGWEMSLRRVLGASVRSILVMVGVETVILFILSAVLALLLTWLVLPAFREYSEITLPLSAIALRLVGYLTGVIVAGLAASSFSAWIIMKRTQRNVLSSRQLSHSSHSLDRFSVILQMVLAMGIIFILVIMLRQINYLMYSEEMGFDHNNMALVSGKGLTEELRHKIRQSPLLDGQPIENVEAIYPRRTPSKLHFSTEQNIVPEFEADFLFIDTLIFNFYRMTLLEGRLPIAEYYVTDVVREDTVDWLNGAPVLASVDPPREICVNEAMCQMMKLKPELAIGQSLYSYASEFRICGVLLNASIDGPTMSVDPAIFMNTGDQYWSGMEEYKPRNMQFRTKSGRLVEMIDSIKAWVYGETLYITNCEENYNNKLQSEFMLIKILMAVGGASLFVCVIGTFSLVSLSLQQRRKEIAVRKVHGARMKDIISLFLRSHVISLFLAALVAYPISYIIMRRWLEGYTKQVGIDWWLIPATFAAIAAVVLATIALKVWRAARESTVEALNA